MQEPPIVKLQIDSMRESIMAAVCLRNKDIERMIHESVDKALSTENLQSELDYEVLQTIRSVIKGMEHDYKIRHALEDLILAKIKKIPR